MTATATLRRTSRAAALTTLSAMYRMQGKIEAGLKRPRVQILMLHDVAQGQEKALVGLIGMLSEQHTFITYSEAVKRVLTGRIDAPYIAITFDDGLRSCNQAARILAERGISATLFLVPPFVGETDRAKVERYCTVNLNIPPEDFISWQDVDELLRQGHEIGGHTMTHSALSALSESALHDEIGGCYRELTRRIGEVRHFAWPFGHFEHFGSTAARIVFETGFESCASAQRGSHVAGVQGSPRNLCLRRDLAVPGENLDHFRYLLARNSLAAGVATNQWPAGWEVS